MNATKIAKGGNLKADKGIITLTDGKETLALIVGGMPVGIQADGLEYGMKVRIERASAGKETHEAAWEARKALLQYYAGTPEGWNMVVSAESKAAAKLAADRTMLIRAFERVYPGDKRRSDGEKNISTLMASKGMTEKAAVEFWLGVGNIAEEVRNIIAEDAAKGAKAPTIEDAGKLLDELLKEKA